ncbi:unnamed protein product [Amoebophrya sp. A25]|nr:unnamed protein product [Amoebophrya sp. A25]|eukprot:GSA25T00001007001.1
MLLSCDSPLYSRFERPRANSSAVKLPPVGFAAPQGLHSDGGSMLKYNLENYLQAKQELSKISYGATRTISRANDGAPSFLGTSGGSHGLLEQVSRERDSSTSSPPQSVELMLEVQSLRKQNRDLATAKDKLQGALEDTRKQLSYATAGNGLLWSSALRTMLSRPPGSLHAEGERLRMERLEAVNQFPQCQLCGTPAADSKSSVAILRTVRALEQELAAQAGKSDELRGYLAEEKANGIARLQVTREREAMMLEEVEACMLAASNTLPKDDIEAERQAHQEAHEALLAKVAALEHTIATQTEREVEQSREIEEMKSKHTSEIQNRDKQMATRAEEHKKEVKALIEKGEILDKQLQAAKGSASKADKRRVSEQDALGGALGL